MNFDNLQFPEIVLAELYKNHLVDIPEQAPDRQKETTTTGLASVAPGVLYLGDHLKKTTILVSYPNDRYIADTQLTFLANVLKACNLNLADIAIVNLASQQVTFTEIVHTLNPERLIVFGTGAALPGLPDLPMFAITPVNNLPVLNAPALEAFSINTEESKLLKTKLWLCLKDLFKAYMS